MSASVTAAALSSSALANAPTTSLVPKPRPSDAIKRTVSELDTLLGKANLSGQIGFVVADARTGLVLEARNPTLDLPPASVAKAVTTAYGLATLGSGHRFVTRIIATGPITGGKIQGDLVLVGGGDPTLDTNQLAELAKALKTKGIKGITGRFRYKANDLPYVQSIDPQQPDHLGYNPAISGLNLNYNRVYFEWKRSGDSYAVAMDARSDRFKPAVTSARMKVVNRKAPIYTYKAVSGVDNWTVARGALGKGGSRWLPVRKPALYTAEVFQVLAQSYGVKLPKPVESKSAINGTEIARDSSEDLGVIARQMLKYSTNLTAEVIGVMASQRRSAKPGTLAASGRVMSQWAKEKYGLKSARFVDHSGLSDASRISADDMVDLLVNLGPDHALHGLMKEITPRGEDGKKLAGAGHKIRAKTGTLNFVSALSGFVTGADGTPLAFAIFTADMDKRKSIKRADRERPPGARTWSTRSRWLQYQLLNRWAALYGS
ncbi:D-alanyl-D-alanine carboxypeptidase/D-alanyl-D-alanine-endopeptidase [Aliiroseovarius sp. KMU-50]|uniref:D-alanyl-D-alanine carboxypeptidase/D-alanyl-D-alanine-endopeptidase n=1 Tax=Aliiroseovarius salicola TaxID=3009082 RepID=A0ABT4W158_9RHOB|nr:D-alanyl-D-alanine carboxypeptidase/D-alanyl-D-alanine-endopeptidase [Aliiroseovarius sp. KMU-50]MDA5094246.1 D-alanyl-D-alanine carboxypeptidase/D-alanyl-D-alanine-endopeptidase [Aliiroseovarius sp. KMU-50]